MDEQLKRRLMGAAIVVALVVIFVPMLFEDKSAGTAGEGAEIPTLPEAIEEKAIELPKSAADVAPVERSENKNGNEASGSGYRIVPLDEAPPKPAKPEPPTPTPQAAAPAEEGRVAPVKEDLAAEPESAPAAKPEADTTTEAPIKGKDSAAKKSPKRGGETVRSTTSPRTREPGEIPSQAVEEPETSVEKPMSKASPQPAKAAEPSARRMEKGRPARASAPKPDGSGAKSAPVANSGPAESAAKPQDPKHAPEATVPSSWMVQAGSFAAEANARALAEKLRKQNLPANVYSSQGESGPIYRVTVGPELNRARAEQIQKQIENAVGLKGIILPQH